MRSVNYVCSCLVYGTLCLQGEWLYWSHFGPVSRLRWAVHNRLKDPNSHGLKLKSNLNWNIEFEVHFCSWLQILLIRFFCGLEIQIKITWENTYSKMLSKSMNPVSVKILNNIPFLTWTFSQFMCWFSSAVLSNLGCPRDLNWPDFIAKKRSRGQPTNTRPWLSKWTQILSTRVIPVGSVAFKFLAE